jgi:SAM-dependent methyltransferase
MVDFDNFSRQKKAVVRMLGDVRNKKILEFGCGNGLYSIYLSRRGADVTGIDIGNDIILLANQAAQMNSAACKFFVGNIISIPFGSETFDYVIGHGVLHHLHPSWLKRSIQEAYRVLRPGGKAYFSEPVENSRVFHFIQNIVPIDSPHSPQKRPSVFQLKKWKAYTKTIDDRGLSDQELIDAKGLFDQIAIEYYGWLIRLTRLSWGHRFRKLFEKVDVVLTSRLSPVKKLSQCVLVCYSKSHATALTGTDVCTSEASRYAD